MTASTASPAAVALALLGHTRITEEKVMKREILLITGKKTPGGAGTHGTQNTGNM
jgi:hypothetical protein